MFFVMCNFRILRALKFNEKFRLQQDLNPHCLDTKVFCELSYGDGNSSHRQRHYFNSHFWEYLSS